MRKTSSLFFFYFLLLPYLFAQVSPDELYDELYVQVQMESVFEDSKTFPDCIPLYAPELILKEYRQQKELSDFDLKKFVLTHFLLPEIFDQEFQSDTSVSVTEHIHKLWPVLTRNPDTIKGSSLIPLPYPYIVPGGRFREIYYWDSYFTMLGLQKSKEKELMRNMADNFSFLIDEAGFIPNGNRTYYLSRSQPPFYSLIIQLLAEQGKDTILKEYLPYLEKEYKFWMSGTDSTNKNRKGYRRVVQLKRRKVLNRYWDDQASPRPESYKEDVELTLHSKRDPEELYREIRAACESGWDFSSRWFKDGKSLETIHTTDIIPVDLNCLLLHLEQTLAEAYELSGDRKKKRCFQRFAKKRKSAILKYCWDKKEKFFMDYDFIEKKSTGIKSLASAYPLFFNLCSGKKASIVKEKLITDFMRAGGMVTTLQETGQQWDAPNGWAPLQWIVVKGLMNYGFTNEASDISFRWIKLNTRVYKSTGKMLEKYNVVNPDLKGGGGEYPLQDGFGWTNGVFLKLCGIQE